MWMAIQVPSLALDLSMDGQSLSQLVELTVALCQRGRGDLRKVAVALPLDPIQ